ncbi:putative glycolipid-binding domain-containing protein [Nisaea nitritireducens]|uniref:putative glycolipid-binding domain-containing protein n=1 Tax=Nisaea nitritireducens TaxID=568392 RepID=UPI0018666429|nr:putative glycolipid-binding domain-containing protein [Nisaea nitritireducens]
MKATRYIIWRRLDEPGTDLCRIMRSEDAWHLKGTATGLHGGMPLHLDYHIACDSDWVTRKARLLGWADGRRIDLIIRRDDDGGWTCNEKPVPAVMGASDIDLGFTPATNTVAVRRSCLAPGTAVETTAAWLDEADWSLKPLRQIYRRVTNDRFEYVSPANGFKAMLLLDEAGLVRNYPGLWAALDRRGEVADGSST